MADVIEVIMGPAPVIEVGTGPAGPSGPPGASLAYADLVLRHGASYYWRLGEPSGATAVDSVGGVNGTISGGVTLGAAGALSDGNKAMTFDGTTGKIVMAAVTIPVAATIEAWVQRVVDGTIHPLIALGSGQSPSWYLDPSGFQVFFDAGSGSGAGAGTVVVTAGMWHQVVCTLNGSVVTFYTDGVLDRSLPYARVAAETNTASLACDPAFGAVPNGFLNGSLDEVAIYPRVLTAPEIAAHFVIAGI